jgi:hypothetical protein
MNKRKLFTRSDGHYHPARKASFWLSSMDITPTTLGMSHTSRPPKPINNVEAHVDANGC